MPLFINGIYRYIGAVLIGGMLWIPTQASAQISVGDILKKTIGQQKQSTKKGPSRALSIDSIEKTIAPTDSVVTFTVTNNYTDSAYTLIRLHRRPPPLLLPPANLDTTSELEREVEKPKPSLVSDDDGGGAYKELWPWVTSDVKEFTLAPGESRTVTVKVKLPVDLPAGEYVTWFATHVILGGKHPENAPPPRGRIVIPLGTQIVSSAKLTLKK